MTGENEIITAVSCAGYILAGGASSRFGSDKALAQLSGKTMLARMHELLGRVARDVRVVAASANYGDGSMQMVPDRWPGEGPLGGIITALEDARERDASTTHCLIASCDMPFLTHEWLTYLCQRAAASDAEVVVPQSAQGLEPLCACWRTTGLGALTSGFEEGVRKVTEGMKRLRMEVLDEAHWKRFDSAGRLFGNMNTPQDYEDAVKVLSQEPP